MYGPRASYPQRPATAAALKCRTRPATSTFGNKVENTCSIRVLRISGHRGVFDAWGTSTRRARLRLQPGLDGFEQPEAHRTVIASEQNHEAHLPMLGSVGIARQRADSGNAARLKQRAIAAAEQGGMGLEEVQQLCKAAGREAVAAADARAFLEMDGLGETVLGDHLVRDLERLLETDGPAQAITANL